MFEWRKAIAVLVGGCMAPLCSSDSTVHAAGRVVLAPDPFVLDASDARDLDDGGARVVVGLDASTLVDPFERRGTPAERIAPFDGGREPCERIAKARTIVLAGGSWLAWHAALSDARHPTRLARALVEAHERGATIAGCGGAAFVLGGATVLTRQEAARPSHDPHERSPLVVVAGLGLCDAPLASAPPAGDAIGDGRASVDLLLERALDGQRDSALFLDGAAWIADPSRGTARVAGSGRALHFDLSAGKRSRDRLAGVRLDVLGAGDELDTRRRRLVEPGQPFPGEPRTIAQDDDGWPTTHEILGAIDGTRASAPRRPARSQELPRIVRATVAVDELSSRTVHGGASRLRVDLEIE